jgi:NAD(P)-dependent dehydrogenase (short-subunit alcohol dehydrogenase family)
MRIGLLGAGSIGKTLARKLAGAGHDVKVANSRGPHTIPAEVLETGARAATAEDAVTDADVVIVSMPYTGFEKIRPLIAACPSRPWCRLPIGTGLARDNGRGELGGIGLCAGRNVTGRFEGRRAAPPSSASAAAPAGLPRCPEASVGMSGLHQRLAERLVFLQ